MLSFEGVELLHAIHNDVTQALEQIDIIPKEDILQTIVEKGMTNNELAQVRKTLIDEAVTTYEECIEKVCIKCFRCVSNLTLNGLGSTVDNKCRIVLKIGLNHEQKTKIFTQWHVSDMFLTCLHS